MVLRLCRCALVGDVEQVVELAADQVRFDVVAVVFSEDEFDPEAGDLLFGREWLPDGGHTVTRPSRASGVWPRGSRAGSAWP